MRPPGHELGVYAPRLPGDAEGNMAYRKGEIWRRESEPSRHLGQVGTGLLRREVPFCIGAWVHELGQAHHAIEAAATSLELDVELAEMLLVARGNNNLFDIGEISVVSHVRYANVLSGR